MKTLFSLYAPNATRMLLYMLQQEEYDPAKYMRWFWRLIKSNASLTDVQKRKKLVLTSRARLLGFGADVALVGVAFILAVLFVIDVIGSVWLFVGVVALLPLLLPFNVAIFALLAHRLVILPERTRLVAEATDIFAAHTGVKIAVLGSYGKTTMKECLATVLSEGKKVAQTPGNMNVSISHARFAKSLQGDEEVLIVEFGEGEPGDIARMAEMLKPDYAIVTGLAPNHLDHYANLQAVAEDLMAIYSFVSVDRVLANDESAMLQDFLPVDAARYSTKQALGWKVKLNKSDINGLDWTLTKGGRSMNLASQLLGEYQLAPLTVIAGIADQLGLSADQVTAGMAQTKPFEHRMQPRSLHGAWLIDDTYNGNLEGMLAGLQLLSRLEATRKWYVTPGLVDQGIETERVHSKLGVAIAEAAPDIVVLMKNSVTETIVSAMQTEGFSGELRIEEDPLAFYTQIEHLIAAGDIVLMQNDWTDNYN